MSVEAPDGGEESENDEPQEVDSDLVFDARDALETHLYPLEECRWQLKRLLRGDDGTATRMLRCVGNPSDRADVLACDTVSFHPKPR